MKVIAPVIIGGRTYQLEVEGETMADIVRQIAPWQDLEQFAKKDAVFSYRKSPDGKYEFYALHSPGENMEMPLGVRTSIKGQLFAGKMVQEGKSKRLVRQWQSAQYGGHIEDEEPGENGTTGNSGKLLQMPATQPAEPAKPSPAQNGQQAQGAPKTSNGVPEPSVEEKRALAFVAMQMVNVTNRKNNKPDQWEVGNDNTGSGPHSVWRDGQDRPQCSCPELTQGRKAEPGYRCAHILAVKIYHEQLTTQQAKKAS